jgi:hypothetical protein
MWCFDGGLLSEPVNPDKNSKCANEKGCQQDASLRSLRLTIVYNNYIYNGFRQSRNLWVRIPTTIEM